MPADANPSEPAATNAAPECSPPADRWPKLSRGERLAVGLMIVVVAVISIGRLPPGVCYGDSGDLQAAAATWGIAHPPGYTSYVTLAGILALVPGIEPAYLVSLGCLASMVTAITLCVLSQVRLGANAWVAAIVGLGLTAAPRVWQSMLAPEVYGPTLAFLAGATYLLIKYDAVGRRRNLLIAALLLGVAATNRPPVVILLPLFAVAAVWSGRRWRGSWRPVIGPILLSAGCFLLPAAYGFAYLWLRDRPETPCNYIEQYNLETAELPSADAGPRAKLERIAWLTSGAQYRDMLGYSWRGVWNKLKWLRGEIAPWAMPTPVLCLAIAMLGAVAAARRCRISVLLLAGLAAQPVVYVCLYRIYGQAADLLPLIWALGATAGPALSVLVPRETNRTRRLAVTGLFVAFCVWTVLDAGDRPSEARAADASAFVRDVDLATFPERAIICSSWGTSPPLWYAQHVRTGRDDLLIINAGSASWLRLTEPFVDRPVFVTDSRVAKRLPPGWSLKPFRKLWRLERTREETTAANE